MKNKLLKLYLTLQTLLMSHPLLASGNNGIEDSVIVEGTQKLLNDITTVLLFLSPTIAVALIIYFSIRLSGSDETEHKKWKSRITITVICTIVAVLASTIIKVILSYYQ